MVQYEIIIDLLPKNQLSISVLNEDSIRKISVYNKIEAFTSIVALFLILPTFCLYVAIVGIFHPFLSILFYFILAILFSKIGKTINIKILRDMYDPNNYDHYYFPLDLFESDLRSKHEAELYSDIIVNIGLLCFERGINKKRYLEIGGIIGMDGYKLGKSEFLPDLDSISISTDFFIPILISKQNKIYPILPFEDWYRVYLGDNLAQVSYYMPSSMQGSYKYIEKIAKLTNISTRNNGDTLFEYGFIIYQDYPDSYGVLLRKPGKVPTIYDPYRDVKIPEDKLDPSYVGAFRKDGT